MFELNIVMSIVDSYGKKKIPFCWVNGIIKCIHSIQINNKPKRNANSNKYHDTKNIKIQIKLVEPLGAFGFWILDNNNK